MMRFHVIGDHPSLHGIPKGEGVSLAVWQFVELVRGQRSVMRPANLFRVGEVRAEELYCLHCFGARWFDVVYPRNPLWKVIKRCRNCGKEGGG